MKRCVCCGYESQVHQQFMRVPPHRRTIRDDPDQWMCRSETKCIERGVERGVE